MILPFHFPSFSPSMYPCLAVFQFMAFVLISFNCYYVYSFRTKGLVMNTNRKPFSGEDYFLAFLLPIVICLGLGSCKISPFYVSMSPLVQSYLSRCGVESSCV